jgi:NAD(P)-dependent dehydrogenase (short-subunit alcohol dehydrogenase family)
VVIVTGANSGIGFETAKACAKAGYRVIMGKPKRLIKEAGRAVGRRSWFLVLQVTSHSPFSTRTACRSKSKTLPQVERIHEETGNMAVEYMHCDMMSLKSVSDFAEAFRKLDIPLHILVST